MSESIEDKAAKKKNKGGRPSLTRDETRLRDAKLATDRTRGRSWSWLAQEYEMSERACHDSFARWREHNKHAFENIDAIKIVHEMLDTYVALQEEAAEMRAVADSDSSRLASISAQMSAMDKAAQLMQATGILPKRLGTLRMEMDVRVMARQLVRVLGEHQATPELKRAMLNVLDGTATPVSELERGDEDE